MLTQPFIQRQIKNIKGTGEFPAQMASNAEIVSISWRHHESSESTFILPHVRIHIMCRFLGTTFLLHFVDQCPPQRWGLSHFMAKYKDLSGPFY